MPSRRRMLFHLRAGVPSVLARLAGLRRALGVRTVFNLIAPLSNPARPRRQLLGVAEPRLVRLMAEALAALGVDHAMVVHGEDGLDELSLAAPTRVAEVRGTAISEFEVRPRELGFEPGSAAELMVTDAEHATEVLRRTLAGADGRRKMCSRSMPPPQFMSAVVRRRSKKVSRWRARFWSPAGRLRWWNG